MPIKVSVVVPVWNPGPNLQRCLDSLFAQSLAPEDVELVLVDDGSTDGTAARLDALAQAQGDRVQVRHIPNSGWPGTPRNVGVATARGEYVQFLDNDDVLAPRALEALYELGARSEADVVAGKLSSDFRGVNHSVYRDTVAHRTLADLALEETLTPHKMFRREFLLRHGIRYPEGPAELDDQVFVLRAYARATSLAVLADQACYFYLRRQGAGRNAGDVHIEPRDYYRRSLAAVLDVVDADIPVGAVRDRVLRRFYRVELLGRLSGAAMLAYEDGYRCELVEEIRHVVTSCFGPGVHAGAGAATRTQGRLLLQDDVPGLLALAAEYERITLRATASAQRWQDGQLLLEVHGALCRGEEPLRFEHTGRGWALPASLAPGVGEAERVLGADLDDTDLELSLVSRADSVSFGRTDGLRFGIDSRGVAQLLGMVAIDPATAMGGAALSDGLWDLRLRLRFAGWSRSAPLRPNSAGPRLPQPAVPFLAADGTVVSSYWTQPKPTVALDVGQWARSLAEQVAASSMLEATGRRTLRLRLRFLSAASAPMPPLELLLEPEDATPGELLACTGELAATPGGTSAVLQVPGPLPEHGSWLAWLRLGQLGGAPPVRLPWRLCRTGARSVVERAAATR